MISQSSLLSIVLVLRNQSRELPKILRDITQQLVSLISDYELIIVDNASDDESIALLKQLVKEQDLPNLQIYALTKEVDNDIATWVGMENALGDFVVAIDYFLDDINFLSDMLSQAENGSDVVFANNRQEKTQGLFYNVARMVFNLLYKWFNGIHLVEEAPRYRVLSRRVINFILQHPQPALAYRYLPATAGFSRANLNYSGTRRVSETRSWRNSLDRGVRLLVSTARAPMRIVTLLSLFGAIVNLVYSIYVILIGIFKENVAAGWISLSLQQSGMFFLISLVLMVLGEYLLHVASLSSDGPLYHIAQEFTSTHMTSRDKLNVETLAKNVPLNV